ncbi:MAG TPA: GlsB/YeaQ/YmgE family stress response membrane protein, partial [Gammaproteobacteria bacterium]|nr:GlsB/YeaQ/YmgE family stress response membrane protein [Gammaproteobacteria bacterium]
TALGFGAVTGFNIWSIIIAILGAILLLFIYRLVMGRRSRV